MEKWEHLFEQKIRAIFSAKDPAHDYLHFKRVVTSAKKLCAIEKADMAVVVPAAWLHDLVNLAKNDPRRSQASRMSADAALSYLKEIAYPSEHYDGIYHAIEAHSFSANIKCQSLEAEIIQDADRMDSLGAIGVGRCFATAGLLERSIYSENDPFCRKRQPDDMAYTIDHFYQKLFKIVGLLNTVSGRKEGERRLRFIESFLHQLESEIG